MGHTTGESDDGEHRQELFYLICMKQNERLFLQNGTDGKHVSLLIQTKI